MVLLITLKNSERKIVELPLGTSPDFVAERERAVLFDLCASEAEARLRIAEDPNGKPSLI